MTKETKMAAPSGEVRNALADFLCTFEAFKEANDDRLAQIERKSASDVITAEKVDRINSALTRQQAILDRLALNDQRAPLGGALTIMADERKSAFETYMRTGDTSALIETKDLSVGGDGGFIVAPETEELIDTRLARISPIRAIATVRQIGSNTYKKPVGLGDAQTGGWADETTARATATTPPTIKSIDFPTAELYAMPAATQTLLDDTHINIDEWLAQEVEQVFASQEGAAFVKGTGTDQPKGFMTYTKVAETSHAWDSIGFIKTGVAGDWPATDPADILLDLIHTPKAQFRIDGRFVMNRTTAAAVRKLKDGAGSYVWQPSLVVGQPATVFGYPVTEAEEMDNIADGNYAIAFGDFRRGYLIVDRAGVRVLRDPFSAKPYVLFYTTKRVGGGVQDFDAIKLLQFAA